MMVWKRQLPLKMAIFGIDMLDFWGVSELVQDVLLGEKRRAILS